ncbi:MAG: tail fiber domain-containing protein [Xanthobacteraceae bacterium]|nr:tail fiber domain-containing protein [Xanthobacteraceae bacterium]
MSHRTRSAAVGALMATALILPAPAAMAQPVAGTEAGVAVQRAREAAQRIGEFHRPFAKPPKERYYCETMDEGEAALAEITRLARRAVAANQPALAMRLIAVATALEDELAEEDYLIEEFGPLCFAQERRPVRVADAFKGPFVGFQVATNHGSLDLTERLAATGTVTNRLAASGFRGRVGFNAGYGFGGDSLRAGPGDGSVRIMPFLSAEFSNETVRHTFSNGAFIGTKTNWVATVGARVGFVAAPATLIYGVGGVSVINQDLEINFGGPVTPESRTRAGASVGLGFGYHPPWMQGFGAPVSVFGEYQRTWWQDSHLTMPAASPAFNYDFKRYDDTFRAGITVWVGSDVRLKRDIARVGRTDHGLGLYRYRYVAGDETYVGVMAHEVAQVAPAMVRRGTDGYLRVDYGGLGLRPMTYSEWAASSRRAEQGDE